MTTPAEPVHSTSGLIAVPFDPFRGDPAKVTRILDWLEKHPLWFASGQTPEEVRLNVTWMMTDPSVWKWEAWSGADLVGLFVLTHVVPRADARFHFTSWGVSLFRMTRLIDNFLGHIFHTFDLQRISVEVPETERKLERFYRQRLGFRYEGELDLDSQPVVQFLSAPGPSGRYHMPDAGVWMARQGSRREQAHFDGRRWRDLVVLRVLRSEYHARGLPEASAQATREPSGGAPDGAEDSDVACRHAG